MIQYTKHGNEANWTKYRSTVWNIWSITIYVAYETNCTPRRKVWFIGIMKVLNASYAYNLNIISTWWMHIYFFLNGNTKDLYAVVQTNFNCLVHNICEIPEAWFSFQLRKHVTSANIHQACGSSKTKLIVEWVRNVWGGLDSVSASMINMKLADMDVRCKNTICMKHDMNDENQNLIIFVQPATCGTSKMYVTTLQRGRLHATTARGAGSDLGEHKNEFVVCKIVDEQFVGPSPSCHRAWWRTIDVERRPGRRRGTTMTTLRRDRYARDRNRVRWVG